MYLHVAESLISALRKLITQKVGQGKTKKQRTKNSLISQADHKMVL
jgi:hypothetical protein